VARTSHYVIFCNGKHANAFSGIKSGIEGFPEAAMGAASFQHRFAEVPMFKRTAFVLMAVAGVALSTSPAAATEVARYSFAGSQAYVTFQASTSLTCIDDAGVEYGGYAVVVGTLQGAEQISSSTGSPPFNGNGTYVQVDVYYNSCTGVGISASGGVSGGFVAPDKKLTSASLTGSGTVQDFSTALQYPVSLDLQVVGVGNTTNSKSNSRTKVSGTKQGPLSITHDHSANSNRAGELAGSITVDGITFPTVYGLYASLIANSTSSTNISK
jgi:hypothetical protein